MDFCNTIIDHFGAYPIQINPHCSVVPCTKSGCVASTVKPALARLVYSPATTLFDTCAGVTDIVYAPVSLKDNGNTMFLYNTPGLRYSALIVP